MLLTGLDLVEVARIEAAVSRWGRRFLDRIFTPAEQADAAGRAQSLAARWAAKEAAAKALGVGLAGPGAPPTAVPWTTIEVRRPAGSPPTLQLHGAAAERAQALGVREISISLSHAGGLAAAVVILLGPGGAVAVHEWPAATTNMRTHEVPE